ncbi:MAG: DNA adenine methylase [Candidatus Caldarchaeum sp.]
MVTSPIRYVGGKHFMVKYIVPIIEAYEHTTYVEPFGGAAHILLAKRRSKVEVYNDINDVVVNFFRVVADKEMCEELIRLVSILPYSRKLLDESKVAMHAEKDAVKRAAAFFIVSRQCFGGDVSAWSASWGYDVAARHQVSSWCECPQRLMDVHNRLQSVRIECFDFRKVFEEYDDAGTLFYCDPPYVLSTRHGEYYEAEMSDRDHIELVDILLRISGDAIVSGYSNEIYDKLTINGWMSVSMPSRCHLRTSTGLSEKPRRTEVIWIHPRIAEAVDVKAIIEKAMNKSNRSQKRRGNNG